MASLQRNKPVGFYGPIVPQGPNAPSSECPLNVMPNCRNSDFRTCPDPEFLNSLHSNLWTRPMLSFWTYLFAGRLCHTLPQMGSSAVLQARRSALVLAASTRCLRRAHSIGRGCRVHTCVMAIAADFKMYLLHQFCSNRFKFFLQYTGDTDAKNDGPECWDSNSVICENFFKFSKRRHAVPLWPIWTIMVAAKLDHSRVLVTKFRQNRSMLKGRSAGQRQTDRQTNSAKNKGPSGLQSGQWSAWGFSANPSLTIKHFYTASQY